MIESIIRKLKGDSGYKWDSNYSTRDIWVITFSRFIQLLRGFWLKLFLKNSAGFVFIGHGVKIKHAYRLSSGKNLILDDGVIINALSFNGIHFGDHVSIGRGSILFCTGVVSQKGTGITIGDRTGINSGAYFGGQGGITVGNDVIMGPDVSIFSENHNFNNLKLTIKEQGVTRMPTIVGNNCWLGAGCKILAGVEIGEGCVVAAGSIVTKSFPANSVLAGIPAKVIKMRGEEK